MPAWTLVFLHLKEKFSFGLFGTFSSHLSFQKEEGGILPHILVHPGVEYDQLYEELALD